MITITGELIAYISPYSSLNPLDVGAHTPLHSFVFVAGDMGKEYTRMGTAQVTLTLSDKDAMVRNKVEALRAQLWEVRAAAQLKAKEIEGEIQKLMAITNEVPHGQD